MASHATEVLGLDVDDERLVGLLVHPTKPVGRKLEVPALAGHDDLVDRQLDDLRLGLHVVHAGLGSATGQGLVEKFVASRVDARPALGAGAVDELGSFLADHERDVRTDGLREVVEEEQEVIGCVHLPDVVRDGTHLRVGVLELGRDLALAVEHRDGVVAGRRPAAVRLRHDRVAPAVGHVRVGLLVDERSGGGGLGVAFARGDHDGGQAEDEALELLFHGIPIREVSLIAL